MFKHFNRVAAFDVIKQTNFFFKLAAVLLWSKQQHMFLKSEGGEKMELPGKDYSFYAKQ